MTSASNIVVTLTVRMNVEHCDGREIEAELANRAAEIAVLNSLMHSQAVGFQQPICDDVSITLLDIDRTGDTSPVMYL